MYLKHDLLFGLRGLGRDRGFSVTAILVLGLGIGVNNMLFTMIYGHTMRGLPIPRADRVLHISTIDDRGADRGLSDAQLDAIRSVAALDGVAAFATQPMIIGDQGRAPERLVGAYVSANVFALLGIAPIFGRGFAPGEDQPGAVPVVIIGDDVWQSRYASDASMLGRSIFVNGTPATVVGVMPDRSGFPSTAGVWLPLSRLPPPVADQRAGTTFQGFARVNDLATIAETRARIESIVTATADSNRTANNAARARVVPISEQFFGRATDPAWLAFISVGFLVLVVSCANTANLMLARSVSRSREIAVRSSLGASRKRIVAQLLTEAVVIAAFSGAIGMIVSLVGVRAFAAWVPHGALPYWLHYGMDGRVFAALVSVSFGTVLIFGLVPALQASRADVNQLLKGGGRGGTSRLATRRLTTGFLAAQLALTVILLCYTVNDVRTSSPELVSDTAIRSTDILSASITLPPDSYATPDERRIFLERVMDGVAAIGGVESATLTSALPLRTAVEQRVEVEGQPLGAGEAGATVWTVAIAPRYFETLSLPMLAGREFSADDGRPGVTRALVNERFVELYLAGAKPLGRRIRLNTPNKPDPEVLGTMAWDGLFFSGRADLRFASPEVLGPVALLLIVITVAACALPMRRVIRLNPVAVLRQD